MPQNYRKPLGKLHFGMSPMLLAKHYQVPGREILGCRIFLITRFIKVSAKFHH
jgi:hypothetical protein